MICLSWLLVPLVWVSNSGLVNAQAEHHIVCTHSRSLFNTPSGAQKCFYECCAIADACKIGDAPKDPYTDPWVVQPYCFDSEVDSRPLACQYHTLESQVVEPEVYSGFIWAKQGEVHTITFPSSLQSPIVFAQSMICAEFHKFATVRVADVTALSFKLRLDLLFQTEEGANTQFGIAWIAFNQWTGVTEFRGMHMHAFKLDLSLGKSHNLRLIRDKASNRVAIFAEVYSFSSELKDLTFQYQNGNLSFDVQPISGVQSNEERVTCGILIVDMSYYNDATVYKFGSLKFMMAPSIFSSGNSFIYTGTLARPYLFYTPYYYRGSGNDVIKLHYMCQWEDFKKDGWLQCSWRNQKGLYESIHGIYGAYFIIEGDVVPRQNYKATDGSASSSTSPCTNVKSILAFTKSTDMTYRIASQMVPRELSTKTDSPLIIQIDNMDRECFDKCVKHVDVCESDVICLQNYLWPSCNLIWNDSKAKLDVQKEEQEGLDFQINYDDVFVELQKSICPSHTELARVEDIKPSDLLKAQRVCELYQTVIKNSRLAHPILVVVSGLVSSDVCDKILAKEPVSKATWYEMSYMEETLVPRGANSVLNMQLLTDNFNLCAFCKSKNELVTFQTLVKDFEAVYAPDGRHNYNDCIEGEWGTWGACQADCLPEHGTVVRQRTRGILHPASGYGRPCKTIEIEDCSKHLPNCNKFCSLSQWTQWSECKDSKRHRKRYIQYYTTACEGRVLENTEACTVQEVPKPDVVDDDDDETQAAGAKAEAEETSLVQTDDVEKSTETHEGGTASEDAPATPTPAAAPSTPPLQEPDGPAVVNSDDQCSIWSQWSGCTSGCSHASGFQYRVKGKPDGSLCQDTEKRQCKGTSECDLQDEIDCAKVVPAYYSDVDRLFCTEECLRLLKRCTTTARVPSDDGSAPSSGVLECFARQRLESPLFFSKCHFPNQVEETLNTLKQVFQNQCFIARSGYSVADSSWVDTKRQSCVCSIYGAVACSAKDAHANKAWIDEELRTSIFCPIPEVNDVSFLYKKEQGTPDSLTYVALADKKRLHCPLSLNKANDLTFGSFASDTALSDFCQHGPLYELYQAKALGKTPVKPPAVATNHKYDCSIVKSKNPGASTEQCRGICNNVDSFCSLKGATIGECVRERLTNPKYQDYALFQKHTCKLPSDPKYNFNDDCQAIHLYTYNEQRKKACMTICRNALMHCQAEILTTSEHTRDECMKNAFGHGTTTTTTTTATRTRIVPSYSFLFLKHSIDSFKKNCRFDLRLQTGGGYVLCKFPPQECQYGEWSAWSPCTLDCNDFGNIGTRYRTRQRLGVDNSICQQTGLGTLEFGICTHLQGCSNGKWFDDVYKDSSHDPFNNVIDYKAFGKGNKSDLAEWVTNAYTQYPELKDDVRCSKSCRIFKSVKISAKDTTTCGCPKGYKPCSFSMAVSSPQWFEQMSGFCKEKPMASVTFEGVIGIYKYYCHIGMLLIQSETSAELACEYVDNNEYIACVAQVERVFQPTSLHFLMLGSGCAVLFALYITIRTLMHRRKLQSQRNAIFGKKTR